MSSIARSARAVTKIVRGAMNGLAYSFGDAGGGWLGRVGRYVDTIGLVGVWIEGWSTRGLVLLYVLIQVRKMYSLLKMRTDDIYVRKKPCLVMRGIDIIVCQKQG